jgi:hypothetical protein
METPPLSSETPILIGRETELTTFAEILQERSGQYPLPAVIAVVGAAGLGKTSLLRAFESLAVRANWKTIFLGPQSFAADGAGGEAFESAVRKGLGFEKDEAFVEPAPTDEVRKPDTATQPPPAQAISAPSRPSFARELSARSRRAPVLILVDDFEPDLPTARWLTERFLPEFSSSQSRAIVVLGYRALESETLSRNPGLKVFQIGNLTGESLRRRLIEIGPALRPPLTEAELAGYAGEASMRPDIAGSLLRVLELALPGPPAASGVREETAPLP